MPQAIAEERSGGRKTATVVLSDPAQGRGQAEATVQAVSSGRGGGVGQALRHAFLPQGFPTSVSSDYLGE